MYKAIVLGSTGAVGREVVAALTASPACSNVTAVTRRPLEGAEALTAAFPSANAEHLDKIHIAVADFASQETVKTSLTGADWGTADLVVYALGSTRGQEGGSDRFRAFEMGSSHAIEELAGREGGRVNCFSVVSSMGADANSPFTYMAVKGEIERDVRRAGFPFVRIFQPGLLDRKDKTRFVPRITARASSSSTQP